MYRISESYFNELSVPGYRIYQPGAAMNMAQNWEAPFTGMSMGLLLVPSVVLRRLVLKQRRLPLEQLNGLGRGNTADFHAASNFIALFDPFTEVSGAIAALSG